MISKTMPVIHPEAIVSPDATVSGHVTIGPGCRVQPGARIVAEGEGKIDLGQMVIVLENAVIRATSRHDCRIGSHVLIGPHAHIVGATLDDDVFVATGASVFHGSHIGQGSELRINAIVHIKTILPEGSMVPIGWVAVGEPAQILSPDRHDEIWALQKPLDFPGFVYGVDRRRADVMTAITEFLSKDLA